MYTSFSICEVYLRSATGDLVAASAPTAEKERKKAAQGRSLKLQPVRSSVPPF